jgi:hypothetical protein
MIAEAVASVTWAVNEVVDIGSFGLIFGTAIIVARLSRFPPLLQH